MLWPTSQRKTEHKAWRHCLSATLCSCCSSTALSLPLKHNYYSYSFFYPSFSVPAMVGNTSLFSAWPSSPGSCSWCLSPGIGWTTPAAQNCVRINSNFSPTSSQGIQRKMKYQEGVGERWGILSLTIQPHLSLTTGSADSSFKRCTISTKAHYRAVILVSICDWYQ